MYPSLAASGINLVSHKQPTRGARPATRGSEDYRHRRRRERRLAAVSAMSTPGIFSLREHAVHPSTGASDRTAAMGEGWGGRIYKRRRWATRTATAARIPSAVPSSRRRQAPSPARRRHRKKSGEGGRRRRPLRSARLQREHGATAKAPRDTGGTTTVARGLFGERRKFEDEGKLRKVSERLFSDDPASTAVRRSSLRQAAPNAARRSVAG